LLILTEKRRVINVFYQSTEKWTSDALLFERFPEDFMFQLIKEEADSLRFQTGFFKIPNWNLKGGVTVRGNQTRSWTTSKVFALWE
jgi:hypothetical protein